MTPDVVSSRGAGSPETSPGGARDATARPKGLDTVALALSGGGFRAAGFHLGVLVVLHRTGLLDRVRILSATSGGSIVAAYVLLQRIRRQPYDETHFALCAYLLEARPVPAALRRAAKERTTLTQAFARELEETLFDDSRFSVPTMREIFESRTSVAEGSFNAAELRSGRPFRFSFSRGSSARVGHHDAHLPRVIAEHMHLADVVAASCAFPGAFEPLVIPDDFVWPDDDVREEARRALGGVSRGLVDGGVHDNQGIDAMLLATKRHDEDMSLHIVSDADRGLAPDEPRDASERPSFLGLRVWHVTLLGWVIVVAALASIWLLWKKVDAERAIDDFRWPTDAVAYGVPIALCVAAIVTVLYVRGRVRRAILPLVPLADRRAWRAVRRMRVTDVIGALQIRVRTLTGVAAGAFPRRVRSLLYREAWASRSLVGKRVAVQIYAMAETGDSVVESLSRPREALVARAQRAAQLPTALELGSEGELNDLLVTGQATAIAKLVEYLEVTQGVARASWPKELVELDEKLHADWEELNASAKPLRP